MSWAYSPSYGKPLSVPQGIIGLLSRFGMQVTLAYPDGYHLIPEVVEIAKKNCENSGGSFDVTNDMREAFHNADVVYPKSWAPYHVMQSRTTLLRQGDSGSLKKLEAECLAENARFIDWECTSEKMRLTRDGKALYMHCLPADISGVSCKQGEVEDKVFEQYRIATYLEAGFKPFVIAAIILCTRFENPARMLAELAQRSIPRRGL